MDIDKRALDNWITREPDDEFVDMEYECQNCGRIITVKEFDKTFPDPPDGWRLIQDEKMVVLGCIDVWLCPDCSKKQGEL